MARAVPSPPESPEAREGTFAHEVGEWALRNPALPIPTSFEFRGVLENVPEEMQDGVRLYRDAVLKIADGYGTTAGFEQRFHLKQIHPDAFGTSDAWVYDSKDQTLYVFDLKYGAGIMVGVAGNKQLRYYALGVLLTIPYPATKVVIVIVQPRGYHVDGPVREERIDALELLDFAADLKDAIARTEDLNASLAAGAHCKFCPAARVCPELDRHAQEVAKLEFSAPVEVVDAVPVPAVDHSKISAALAVADALEFKIRQLREFAYSEAMHGRTPPGWKLAQKRARRKWRDEKAAADFLAMYGLEPAACFTDPELKSPAQVEDIIRGKKFKEAIKPLTVSNSSGYVLVPESDNRPAIKLDAKSEFTAVIENHDTGPLLPGG